MYSAGNPWRTFIARLAATLDGAADVLDIGTDQRFSKELRPLETMFDKTRYIAAGFRPETRFGAYNCDLHLDVCAIEQPEDSYDAVICLEVLEHCVDPFAASRELLRILRPGGALFLTVPFLTGYHGHQDSGSGSHSEYPDYWRFTHQGLERMFSGLEGLEVTPLDGPLEFRIRMTPAIRLVDRFPLRQLIDRFDRPRRGKATTRHLVTGRKPLA